MIAQLRFDWIRKGENILLHKNRNWSEDICLYSIKCRIIWRDRCRRCRCRHRLAVVVISISLNLLLVTLQSSLFRAPDNVSRTHFPVIPCCVFAFRLFSSLQFMHRIFWFTYHYMVYQLPTASFLFPACNHSEIKPKNVRNASPAYVCALCFFFIQFSFPIPIGRSVSVGNSHLYIIKFTLIDINGLRLYLQGTVFHRSQFEWRRLDRTEK